MKQVLYDITFAAWEYARWWPLLIVVLVITAWSYFQVTRRVALLASGRQRAVLITGYRQWRLLLKKILWLTAFLLLGITLLRPQWGVVEQTIAQEGRDLFIALDVSRSMLAADKEPNRLAFAKRKIKELVQSLKSERVGLLLFSGSAVVQCPLTVDHGAFYLFLDQIDAETISSGTTALDAAIKKVIDMFARAPSRKEKLLAIFTDGEDFSSNLSQVRKEAADVGLHIFTIGVGSSQGAPVPIVDEQGRQRGHQKDASGNVVISRLNEGILAALAEQSGGIYVRAADDSTDTQELVKAVEQFEREKFEDTRVDSLQDRYPLTAAAAFICLVVEWLL
jgi:Ca-activated chloride channel family protein